MSIRESGGSFEVRVEYRARYDSRDEAVRAERSVRSGIAKACDGIAFGLSPCVTIREGLNAFLSYQRATRRNASITVSDHRRHLTYWAQSLGGRSGDVALDRISIDAIDSAIAELSETHSPATVNKYLGSLRRYAAWAVKKHRIPPGSRLDWLEFERVSVPKRDVRVLTRHEFRTIMKRWPAGGTHVARVLWFMAITGARPQAVIELTWGDVHREKSGGGFISFRRLKGGNLVSVPFRPSGLIARILDDAADFWRATRGRSNVSKRTRVFVPGKRGTAHDAWTIQTFCDAVRFHADRIGADGFTSYIIRHSIMTQLAKDGVADDQRKNFAGHTTTAMQAVYVHTSGVDAVEVRDEVERWLAPTYALIAARTDHQQASDAPDMAAQTIPETSAMQGQPFALQPITLDGLED